MTIATHTAKFNQNVACRTCNTPDAFKQGYEYEAAQSIRGIVVNTRLYPAMNVRHSLPSNNPLFTATTCAANFEIVNNMLYLENRAVASLTKKQ